MNGVLPLYKERGMTSFDCIRRLRQLLKTKKIGHSGTLDPNVSGVLPICIGNATKLVPYLMVSGKKYAGEVLIGQSTTTEDLDGDLVKSKNVPTKISDDQITNAMNHFVGEIIQIPPMYSAVKVNGKRLYEYARAGETVERPERKVTIYNFQMVANTYDQEKQQQRVRFTVECSKGTYVRTLAVDLAKELGYPGTMSSLTRLKSGGFELDQTLSLQDVEDEVVNQTIANYVYPASYVLRKYPQHQLTDGEWKKVQNGGWLSANQINKNDDLVVLSYHEDVKAIYKIVGKLYKPATMISTQ